MEKRIIGLDYGEARTGVAVSDLLGITAQGVISIKHKSDKELLEKLVPYVEEYEPVKFVIGLPINMNATKGARVEKTLKFIDKLKAKFDIEVETIDERLTTVSAHKTMTELGTSKNKKKDIVDMMSAVLILQIYLDKNK
jgi:putative Holliday junction resolvase